MGQRNPIIHQSILDGWNMLKPELKPINNGMFTINLRNNGMFIKSRKLEEFATIYTYIYWYELIGRWWLNF
jgi:hypothetical protein